MTPAAIDGTFERQANVLVSVRAYPWTSWPQVASRWGGVAGRSPYTTFFVDEPWTSTWLSAYGPVVKPEILLFEHDGETVGCCLLAHRRLWIGPVRVHRVYLNASGEDEWEEAGMEFNDLLCMEGFERAVANALHRHINAGTWDFLALDGCRQSAAIAAVRQAFAAYPQTCRSVPSCYVNLRELRDTGQSYESLLPSKSRQNLRQTVKWYKELGDFQVEIAHTVEAALAMLDQCAELHQARWTGKGEKGAFVSSRYMAFQRAIIERLFPAGAIQCVRTKVGQQTMGIAYNFVFRGKVYYYQCGSHFMNDKRSRPGVATLFYAVKHSFDQGLAEYDMMAGDVQYKKTMAKAQRELDWILIQRKSFKLEILEWLKSAKRASVAALRKPRRTPCSTGAVGEE